ncbi:hypothetical protein GGI24_005003, partial [Coemansia furcata]
DVEDEDDDWGDSNWGEEDEAGDTAVSNAPAAPATHGSRSTQQQQPAPAASSATTATAAPLPSPRPPVAPKGDKRD